MKTTTLLPMLFLALSLHAQHPPVKVSAGVQTGFFPFWTTSQTVPNNNLTNEQTMTVTTLSVGAFVDATYATLAIAYNFNVARHTFDARVIVPASTTTVTTTEDSSMQNLVFSLFGKYPITLPQNLSLFPFLGLEFLLNLDVRVGNTKKADLTDEQKFDLNDLYLTGGVGLDWDVTKPLFLRLLGGAGFNFLSSNAQIKTTAEQNDWRYSSWGWKWDLTLGLGIRF